MNLMKGIIQRKLTRIWNNVLNNTNEAGADNFVKNPQLIDPFNFFKWDLIHG